MQIATIDVLTGKLVAVADEAGFISIWQVLHSSLLPGPQASSNMGEASADAQKAGSLRAFGEVSCLAFYEGSKSPRLAIASHQRIM